MAPPRIPGPVRLRKLTNRNGPETPGLGKCWIWTRGPLSRHCPYGHIYINKKPIRVHRYAWMLKHGGIPRGLSVLHKCDRPLCVNPRHLFLGTQKDNQEDMVRKDRQAKGERNANAKLTEKQVREIKRRYKKTSMWRGNGGQLAKEFGVSRTAIVYIATGRNWRHVK